MSGAQPQPLFALPDAEKSTAPLLWGAVAIARQWHPQNVIETPDDVFAELDREFHFTVDVCALPDNAKCARYYTPDDDGLAQDWSGDTCWCNPPYSDIEAWLRKAHESGTTVVCLLPVRSDVAWWHTYAMKASEIRFIRGRVRFKGSRYNAPFPSCLVVFRAAGEDV